MSEFSGTKELIFDAFIEMTSTDGYENVNIRDVAKRVGINSASIYYHFKTKREILEYAYHYYSEHQYDTRKPVDAMKTLIETATPEEIIRELTFTFETDDQKKYVRMILIIKIIYMRLFQDEAANAIFAASNKNNAEYVISILKHGIDIDRIDSAFDIETFADFLIDSIAIMGIKAFARTDYAVGQLEQEKRILALNARLLSTALK